MQNQKDIEYPNITIYGNNAEMHDFFAQKRGGFENIIKRIKNLATFGKERNIIVNVPIIISDCQEKSNLATLEKILRLVISFNLRKIQLILLNPGSDIKPYISIDRIASHILLKILPRYSFSLSIRIKNIPPCLLRSVYGHPLKELVIKEGKPFENSLKFKQCQQCAYFEDCPGVLEGYFDELSQEKIKPVIFPTEVAIEVEPKCNFNCQFCFNKNSFAEAGREYDKLSTDYVKKVIDKISESSIESIRFTGGEPMLRSDIFDLLRYAKSKGLNVKLNTNASLINSYKVAREIARHTDFVLISIHTYDPVKDEKLSGFNNSFSKKLKAMEWLKEAGLKILRVSTVATMDNILNLDKFLSLIEKGMADTWAVNRMIPVPGKKDDFNKEHLSLLVEKLTEIKGNIIENNIPLSVDILNGVPLCALNEPFKLNAVSVGGWPVDGHTRFTIDPRGFAKPIYYINKNIGDPLNPLKCWEHPFMKAIRTYKMVPKECLSCPLLEKCKGGNRFCAYNSYGSYDAPDPLMEFSNLINP